MVDQKQTIGDVTFEIAKVAEVLKYGKESGMFEEHLAEVGFGNFDVNIGIYEKALIEREANLDYAGFSAKIGDEIVGYIAFTIDEHLHHNDRIAQTHVIFMRPEYRSYGIATNLIKFAESHLYYTYGTRFVQTVSNVNKPIGEFLEKLGYIQTDIVYTKQFKEIDRRD